MKITFSYFAQIRQKAGVESETLSVANGITALEALKIADHGNDFKEMLFDQTGALRPVILLVVNDIPVAPNCKLTDGDSIKIFSPVAGG